MSAGPVERLGPIGAPRDGDGGLRILYVCARFTPYVGGTEIHTREVAAQMVRRGHDVTVLTTDLDGRLPSDEVIDGVRVIRVRAWPRRFDLYVAPAMARVIRDGRWDLVHVQGYHTAVAPIALRAARRGGIPTVLTFHSGGHSSTLRNAARPVHARLLAGALRRCDLLIGVSEFEVDLFAERLGVGSDRIRMIPNGVSTTARPACETAVGSASTAAGPHLLSIGRLLRYKGHQRVIRAMPRLVAADPRTRLTILGTGPYQDKLERMVARRGLANQVTFDYVAAEERHRLDEILATASVALFLSDYESHGMAAHEALAAGLPVIVLDSTALGDLASEGLAQAVPPMATDDEVASIVLRTLRDRDEGDERDPVPDLGGRHQTWSSIAATIDAAYQEILAAPAPAASASP